MSAAAVHLSLLSTCLCPPSPEDLPAAPAPSPARQPGRQQVALVRVGPSHTCISTLESALLDTHTHTHLQPSLSMLLTATLLSGVPPSPVSAQVCLSCLVCSSCSPVAPGGPEPVLNVREEGYLDRRMSVSVTHKCNMAHLRS